MSWRERRALARRLRGSSLDLATLYAECPECGERVARDPFQEDLCVYGHRLR